MTQRYRYDGANRLGLASEGGTAPTSDSCPTDAAWRRGYITTPTATSAYGATTNRLAAGSYDGANRLTAYDNNVVSLQERAERRFGPA